MNEVSRPFEGISSTSGGLDLATAIADFVGGTTWQDIPEDVREFGGRLLVDTLGALIGGLRYPPVQALAAALRTGTEEPGRGTFATLMTLGTAATWLDADSGGSFHPQGHRLPPVPTAHPAPHVLPVILDAAAKFGDAELLQSFILSSEVGMRGGVACSLRPGLHPHGIHGPGAAALAAGLLRGVATDRLGDSFLLGASMPLAATLAVPMAGGTVRNAWTGLGSYYGSVATDRVLAGARGCQQRYRDVFDSAVCTDFDEDVMLGGLGQRWVILDSYLKPYACARWIQPALDATRLALRDATGAREVGPTKPSEIAEIDVRTFAFAASLSANRITTDMQARFSLPYSVAAFVTDGKLAAGGFLPDQLARTDVASLAQRVRVHEVAQMTAALPGERPAAVVVTLRDGRSGTGEVRNARGNPDTPLSNDEVAAKFRDNVTGVLPPALVTSILEGFLGASSFTVPEQPLLPLVAESIRSAAGFAP